MIRSAETGTVRSVNGIRTVFSDGAPRVVGKDHADYSSWETAIGCVIWAWLHRLAPFGSDDKHERGLKWLRFVDQHDRNAIANLITQTACLANEFALLLTVLELALALRADEDIQQLRIDHFFLRLIFVWYGVPEVPQ